MLISVSEQEQHCFGKDRTIESEKNILILMSNKGLKIFLLGCVYTKKCLNA